MGIERSAEGLLDSIFAVVTELVRGERVSLLLRDEASTDFVIAKAVGLAEEVKREARVREGVGMAGRVVASKRPLLVGGDPAADLPLDPAARGRYRSDSFMIVPIVVDGTARGVLNVADRSDGKPFDTADLDRLQLLAQHIGACLVQQDQGRSLARLADTDPLTCLQNRRAFDRRLEPEMNRAMRAQALLAVLMIDVDRFKSVNDRFG
ncbi:MAG: GAF domain-containing protein, partial [Deltaproteobacteria bacterium]|nr:GAF domain-containing protein [Deltaproteobacteria bacterium]